MTNRKSTRRALVLSLLSLLLCCSMLVGTTFAWFTDSVTSGNNKIVAGNLDVELYYQNDTAKEWTKVETTTNVFKTDTLWEPGHVEVVKLQVANEGTLALKYQLGIAIAAETGSINKDNEEFKLSDHIKFGVYEGDLTGDRAAAVAAVQADATEIKNAYATPGTLTAGAKSGVLTMVVWMPETVGNEANYKTGEARPEITLGVNLVATQVEAEFDSFGNDYDAGLEPTTTYVSDLDSLRTALAAGGNVALMSDITIGGDQLITDAASIGVGIFVNKDTVLDLNGHDLVMEDNSSDTALIFVHDADLDIVGEGTLSQEGNSDYLLWAKGASVVNIKGGDFITAPDDCTVLYASGNTKHDPKDAFATINVYGGTFTSGHPTENQDNANVMNHGVGKINYYGGTFNWNPSTAVDADDKAHIKVAEGYKVVENNGKFLVLSENTTLVKNAADLKTAMENAEDDAVILLDGTIDLAGKTGAYVVPAGDVTVKGGTIKGTGWSGELNYAVNATAGNIVFDGVTFDTNGWTTEGSAQWGISVNVSGTANVTFKNCVFKGSQCPIYQSGANSVITLEGCTFDTASVAIQCEVYSGDFSLGQDLIVKGCDFPGVADVLHIYDYDKDPSSDAIAQYLTDNGNTFTGVCKQTCP